MPRGTPPAITEKVSTALQTIAADPGLRQRFLDIGARAISSSPAQLVQFAEQERVKWKEIVALSGVPME